MKIKTLLWSGFAAICAVMAVLVSIGIWQLNVIDKAVDNIVRASRNESMAREIAERVNGMRRYQLSALVAADERDQQLERATKAGKENAQLAEELEKKQRNPETRQIVATCAR
jgi:biopolymer transport protein ExbB/TolQ